jgi:alcohol dehydrogenase
MNVKSVPTTIHGVNVINQLGKSLIDFGAKNAFLITDKGLTKVGLTAQVSEKIKSANINLVVYDDVVANPTVDVVDKGAKLLRELVKQGETVVVTLGGGSSMDAGKAIAMLCAQNTDSILDYTMVPGLAKGKDTIDFTTMSTKAIVGNVSQIPKIIAIPTTSGTASETNGAAVITDTRGEKHRKLIYVNDASRASLIIMDPAMTVGVPRYPTATCGMDVLTHALEAYTSAMQNEYSDAIAMGSIKLVAKYLPKLMNDLKNIELRQKLQLASHMAGVAFNISQLGLVHGVGHPLSAVLNQAHGQTLATMLPHVMEYNMPVRAEKYAEVAKAFNVYDSNLSTEANARKAIQAIANLSIQVGTAKSIRDMGGSEKDIPILVNQALTDLSGLTNPRPATREAVTKMYMAAMDNKELYPSSKM